MKLVAEFSRKDAALDRAITEFQSNVDAALRQLEAETVAEGQIVEVRKSGIVARVGQVACVQGDVALELLLAKPLPNDEARELTIVKRGATANLTVRPIGATLNAAATATLTSVGSYRLIVAGGQYWRAP